MVLILDGNSKIGAHVRGQSLLFDLSKHLIRSRSVRNKKKYILHACAACSELPSNTSTKVQSGEYHSGEPVKRISNNI